MEHEQEYAEHVSDARWRWAPWLRPAAALVVWDRGQRPAPWRRLGDLDPGMIASVAAATMWLHGGDRDVRDLPVSAVAPTAADEVRLAMLSQETIDGLPMWPSVLLVLSEERDRWDTWSRRLMSLVTGHVLAGAVGTDPATTREPLLGDRLDAIGFDPASPHWDGGIAQALRRSAS